LPTFCSRCASSVSPHPDHRHPQGPSFALLRTANPAPLVRPCAASGSVAALRASLALVAVFFTLGFVYFMNGIGAFVHHDNLAVAAGVFGFLNALAAFYAAFSGLLTNETSYFLLPVGDRRPAAVRHGAYHE
jgi:hypothetical protein